MVDHLPPTLTLVVIGARGLEFSRRPEKRDQSGQLIWERNPWPGTAARPFLDFPILRNIDTVRISPTEAFSLANML